MKEHLKNPNVYYILIPVIAAVWALTAGFVFYPNSVKAWEDNKEQYEESQEWIEKIITVQPQRLQYDVKKGSSEKFDFSETIVTFTKALQIPSSNYTMNIRSEMKRGDKRSRSATVSMKNMDIEKTAVFVSTLLAGWPDLKCEKLSLEKEKVGKNNWKVDMTLTYTY